MNHQNLQLEQLHHTCLELRHQNALLLAELRRMAQVQQIKAEVLEAKLQLKAADQ